MVAAVWIKLFCQCCTQQWKFHSKWCTHSLCHRCKLFSWPAVKTAHLHHHFHAKYETGSLVVSVKSLMPEQFHACLTMWVTQKSMFSEWYCVSSLVNFGIASQKYFRCEQLFLPRAIWYWYTAEIHFVIWGGF